MELQWIIQALLGIIVTGLGWFMREIHKQLKEVDQRAREAEVDNLKTFALKDDIKDDLKQVHEILANLYNKLDEKKVSPDGKRRG